MKNCCSPFWAVACAVLCLFVFGAALPVSAQTRGDAPFANTSRHAVEERMPTALLRGVCDMDDENVEVEAEGGTPQAGYATLGEAFVAINTGVHTGDIAIEICGSTTEAGPAVLNSSGAGAANYSAIHIYPLIDDAIISANTGQGRGVIELNGADNVTIDGDNPATENINRNLTVTNASASTTNYTSAIRLVTSAAVTSVDNVTIRNMNLNGSAAGRNISSAPTGTTSASNTTFGIFVGGQGPATETGDPLAIASIAVGNVANSINEAATVNNFIAENNAVMNSARAIKFWGRQVARSNSVIVRGNLIGNPNTGDADGVYSMGITVQGSSNILVSMNTVYVESYLATAIRGIEIGPETAAGAFGTVVVEKNQVRRVKSNAGASHGAYGINVSGGSNHTFQNNFVSGVINSQRSTTALNLTSDAVGIRLGAGSDHKVWHNSVHLYGTIAIGASDMNMSTALGIVGNNQTGISIVNNIFSNQIIGGGASFTYNLIFYLPYTTLNANRLLTVNNNAYYVSPSANSFLAKTGGAGEPDPNQLFLAANFDPSSTSPPANFRSHTSVLGSTSNDDSSFATTDAPPFVSDSDLHIPTAYNTQLESGGADVGVLDDIDDDARTSTPDIGADEITAPSSAPVILSGRVISSGFRPLNGARITIMGGGIVQPRSVTVNGFGFYRFEGLEAGQTYIVSVSARGAVFDDPIRVVSLDTDLTDLDFYALP
ncbi:MAG: carboxypeptidase regulatory-like domain-containing protein [Acidobacteria bacterium]|nr:carboxypeptidase regulatory-like domain-containing protein [Acidobacteriota bacterium]